MKYELKFGMLPFVVIITALTGLLAYLGGLPENVSIINFALGIIGIGLSLIIFVLITWHLLFRPIPKAQQVYQASPLSPQVHLVMALILLFAMASEALAATWDETWHRDYGIPFGEDFFWRPHLLLYICLLLSSGLAAFSGYMLYTKAKGTLQQRFRSDPILALLMIAGVFQVFGLSTDPAWHQLYGVDLTGFSLPHIFLGFVGSFFTICVGGLIAPSLPKNDWQGIWKAPAIAAIAVAVVGVMFMVQMLPMSIDWVNLTIDNSMASDALTLNRPDWALPFTLALLSSFCGSLINHNLRVFGGATISAIFAFSLRYVYVLLVGQSQPVISTWLIIIPALLSFDIVYAWVIWRKENPRFWHSVLGIVLGMFVAVLPLMNLVLPAPKLSLETALPMLIAVICGAAVGAFLGRGIGDYLADLPKTEVMDLKLGLQGQILVALATLILIGITAWFIFTSTPPVA